MRDNRLTGVHLYYLGGLPLVKLFKYREILEKLFFPRVQNMPTKEVLQKIEALGFVEEENTRASEYHRNIGMRVRDFDQLIKYQFPVFFSWHNKTRILCEFKQGNRPDTDYDVTQEIPGMLLQRVKSYMNDFRFGITDKLERPLYCIFYDHNFEWWYVIPCNEYCREGMYESFILNEFRYVNWLFEASELDISSWKDNRYMKKNLKALYNGPVPEFDLIVPDCDSEINRFSN